MKIQSPKLKVIEEFEKGKKYAKWCLIVSIAIVILGIVIIALRRDEECPEEPKNYQNVRVIEWEDTRTVRVKIPWEVGNFSAYTASIEECGKDDGITASGKMVEEGRTLACPPEFKFGTKIEIQGRGIHICEDRGGAIKGNKFDIYIEKLGDAKEFGRRSLNFKIIE